MNKLKTIIKNQNDFNNLIWEKIENFGWIEKPKWLTEPNYITKEMFYNALSNKYNNIFIRDTEESFIGGLVNALIQLLPEADIKGILLKNETIFKINWESVLSTTTENKFADGKNIIETYSANSSSPSNEKGIDNFENELPDEKDYQKTIDNRLTVQDIKDVSKAINDISNVKYNGVILNVINHSLIRALFDFNIEEGDVITLEKYERGEQGLKGEPGEQGLKGEPGEKGEKGDPGERPDLNNYLTAAEINNDFLNKKTGDLNEVMGNIAVSTVILTESPVENSNQAARMEDVKKAVEGIGNGNFVETNYFSDNAKLITRNDKISTETAKIGEEYIGRINIARKATGILSIGEEKAIGTLSIGDSAAAVIDIGKDTTGSVFIGRRATGNIDIGNEATGPLNIGTGATGNIEIGEQATGLLRIGANTTEALLIGSVLWGRPGVSTNDGLLVSGNTFSTFRDINNKVNEIVYGFTAKGNSGAPLGTINNSTSQFFNGGTITTGNTVKLDFINSNYTFTDNINPGFTLIRNDTKKLDIGSGNKRVIIKVGLKIRSFTNASVGQLDIAVKSGNLDEGADSIILLNPNPNQYYAKNIAVPNSTSTKAEGISINITSQNGNFIIDDLEVILM